MPVPTPNDDILGQIEATAARAWRRAERGIWRNYIVEITLPAYLIIERATRARQSPAEAAAYLREEGVNRARKALPGVSAVFVQFDRKLDHPTFSCAVEGSYVRETFHTNVPGMRLAIAQLVEEFRRFTKHL